MRGEERRCEKRGGEAKQNERKVRDEEKNLRR
jgi:hypothetical protein